MNLEKLKDEQKRLAKKISLEDEAETPKTIAGCDIEYTQEEMIAAVVVLDLRSMQAIEKKYFIMKPKMPFIPSYQSYRELPPVIEAFTLLRNKPDLVMFPGEGILHPRRIGSASHLGLMLDIPVVGVAGKESCGTINDKGQVIIEEEVRGMMIETKDHAKPLFVSPGHRISMKRSVEIFNQCLLEGKKLPEPLRLAHKFARQIKDNRKCAEVVPSAFSSKADQLNQ